MFCRVCDHFSEIKCSFKCFLPFVSIFQQSNKSLFPVFDFTMSILFYNSFVMCSIWPLCWIILLICRNLVAKIIQFRFKRSRAIRISSDFLVWLMWQGKFDNVTVALTFRFLSHFTAIFVGFLFLRIITHKYTVLVCLFVCLFSPSSESNFSIPSRYLSCV